MHGKSGPVYRLARRAVHALEDGVSVSPEALGDGYWIPGAGPEEDVARGRQSVPPEIRWERGSSLGLSGVCRLQDARVLMLTSGGRRNIDTNRHVAAVFVSRFRRLIYKGAPRVLPKRLRGGGPPLLDSASGPRGLPGRVGLLGAGGGNPNNYYHFWADIMADLALIRHLLPEDRQPEYFLVPHTDQTWQAEVLELCGLDRERLIRFTDHDKLALEELLVPLRDKGGRILPPWLASGIRWVSNFAREEAQESARWIYLSRADATRRRVGNEHEVRELLRRFGFEIHVAGELSVREQQLLFARAAVVVAPHGAGLTNLVWCQEGTRVTELLPSRHQIPCFAELAMQRGLEYQAILCAQDASGGDGITADIKVPIKALQSHIQAFLNPPADTAPRSCPTF